MNGKVGQVDIKGLRSMQNIAGYAASLCIPKYYHQPPSSRGEQGGGHNQGMEETKTTIAFLNDFRRFFLYLLNYGA